MGVPAAGSGRSFWQCVHTLAELANRSDRSLISNFSVNTNIYFAVSIDSNICVCYNIITKGELYLSPLKNRICLLCCGAADEVMSS